MWLEAQASDSQLPEARETTKTMMAMKAMKTASKAKKARKAIKKDNIKRMDDRIADGTWDSIKHIRKRMSANPACLIDKDNKLRGARERATVIAEYLATEQFGRKPNHSYSIPAVLNGYALAPGVLHLDRFFSKFDYDVIQ